MKKETNKVSYTAPKMEATSFKAEQGYAASVNTFKIGVLSGGL